MTWWVLIEMVDVNIEDSFQLKPTTCHYVQDFVYNYVHQVSNQEQNAFKVP